MADPYTQASLNPMDPAALQAAAEAFQRQEAMATLAEITGDPVLGNLGKGMRERTSERRKGLSKAREAALKRQQLRPSGLPGLLLRGNEAEWAPEWKEMQELKHQRELEIARARGQSGGLGKWLAQQQFKQQFMNPSEFNRAAEGLAWIKRLGETIPEVATADEDIAQPYKDIMAEKAGDIGLGGPARALESKYRSESSRSIRTRIKSAINEIRASQFGAALTAMEKPEFAAVDPLAPGLTKDQMLRRLKDLVRGLVITAQIQVGGRMGPGGQRPPAFLEDDYDWMQGTDDPGGAKPQAPQKPEWASDEEWQIYLEENGYQ